MSDKKPSEIIREKFSKIERARESSPTCRADLEIVNMMLQALLEYLDELVERFENSTLGDQNRILFLEQRLDRLEKKG